MDITTLVASLYGPVALAVGIGILLNKKYYKNVFENFMKEAGLVYFGGAAALIAGILILSNHSNVWTLDAAGLVTLIGWIAVLKGLALFILPKQMIAFTKVFTSDNALTAVAIVAILLGAYMSNAAYGLIALG